MTICAGVTGPFAIWQGRSAERAVKQSPGAYGGKGMATAGWILGIIGTIFLVLFILYIIIFAVSFAG